MEEKFIMTSFEVIKTPSKIKRSINYEPNFMEDARLKVVLELRCFGDGGGKTEEEIKNLFLEWLNSKN